jgi:hypothetical protein
MVSLATWYKTFDTTAQWSPHPLMLTKLVFDDTKGRLDSFQATYRGRTVTGIVTSIVSDRGSITVYLGHQIVYNLVSLDAFVRDLMDTQFNWIFFEKKPAPQNA